MGLNHRLRAKRVLAKREAKSLVVVAKPNKQWTLDFILDSLHCGRRFSTLNLIDEGTRECLALEVETPFLAERVVRVLERLKEQRGLHEQIQVDNGPELISAEFID